MTMETVCNKEKSHTKPSREFQLSTSVFSYEESKNSSTYYCTAYEMINGIMHRKDLLQS